FSTAERLRIRPGQRTRNNLELLSNRSMSRYFAAAADATEEAILNSLFKATTVHSRFGRAEALPLQGIKH
ncbi:MAG: P1 family peptidase, partial [Planctomycetota bacterium]